MVLQLREVACLVLAISALVLQDPPPGVKLLESKGDFTEPLSRLKFPVRVIGWERSAIQLYPEPLGHSITYQFKQGVITQARATIYIYPDAPPFPASLQAHYAATLKELQSERPELEVSTETEFTAGKNKNTMQMRMAAMLYRFGYFPYSEPTIGFLAIGKVDTYWIKWRITVPASAAKDVNLDALVSSFVPKKQGR